VFGLGCFSDIKNEIADIPDVATRESRIWSFANLCQFGRWTFHTFKSLFHEREILLFASLQVVAIAIGYYVWVQLLGWIPREVWDSEEALSNIALNVGLLGWSFLVVGLVSLPAAIFSGCIGASHFLKRQGCPSDTASCLRLVMPRAWSLWIFCWVDGWFTVMQILDRLPRRHRGGNRALSELLYYAWKLGTAGMLPSILNGKNLILAGKESILLIRTRPQEVMLLRGGYSLVCWFVGIAAYAGAAFVLWHNPEVFERDDYVRAAYMLAGIPALLSVAVIQLFLRPVFILGSCQLYTEHMVTGELPETLKTRPNAGMSALAVFGLLLFVLVGIFLYREPLGLNAILEVRKAPPSAAVSFKEPGARSPNNVSPAVVPVLAVKKVLDCASPEIRITGSQIEEVCP